MTQVAIYYSLPCRYGHPPAVHGIPKIQKRNLPLRQLVDYIRLPVHRVSGFLHRVLFPLAAKTRTHVRNAQNIIEEVEEVTIPQQ